MKPSKVIEVTVPIKVVIEMPPKDGEGHSLHLIQGIGEGNYAGHVFDFATRIADGSPYIRYRKASITVNSRDIIAAVADAVNKEIAKETSI